MGHYAAEMLGVSDDEAKDHVPTGFIVTRDFRVMTAAKARQTLPFIQYLQAPRFPDEAKAKKAARAATHHLQSWKEGMAKRRSMKGEGNPMYGKGGMKGKVHSAETRAKMAEAHRNKWNNMDDEGRRARSAKLAGASNPMHGKTPSNARKIEYGGVVYNSIAEAVRLTGLGEFFLKKRGAIYG